jgi:7-carboxy-7-deazaguanine synthase
MPVCCGARASKGRALKIAEVFYSVQGEGSLVGVPSVFVRTSGCNLRCIWCDTPYTSWRPEGHELSLEQIVTEVKKHPAKHAVVTGGEPMIAPEIVSLTERLRELGLHITVETAGTVFKPVACDLMSISPKLANSTPSGVLPWARQHERLRINLEVLSKLVLRYPYQLKFVVATPHDLEEIHPLVARLQADPTRVLLMPEGADREILRERGIWLGEICKAEGYRFSPRLHIELYGNRRGV